LHGYWYIPAYYYEYKPNVLKLKSNCTEELVATYKVSHLVLPMATRSPTLTLRASPQPNNYKIKV